MYKPMIFIFCVVVAPGTSDAMFYFESNVLNFTPANFGLLNVIGSCASIIGVWSYRAFFTKSKLSWYFLVITLILSLCQLMNLLIIKYESDGLKIAYGQQLAYGLINELHLMPLMIIACQMCPKNIEATFYALVLAVINAGYLISYWLGGLLTFAFGISGQPGSFGNLWKLILISCILPLFSLFVLLWLPKENEIGLKGIE